MKEERAEAGIDKIKGIEAEKLPFGKAKTSVAITKIIHLIFGICVDFIAIYYYFCRMPLITFTFHYESFDTRIVLRSVSECQKRIQNVTGAIFQTKCQK